MNITIGAAAQKMIEDYIKSGAYATPEQVLIAALAALEREDSGRGFDAGEMDKLLEEGERSGDPLDGDQVFAELRALRTRQVGKAG